ncbi:hypothetical protein Lalb_Chr17g0336041 [Lupinus albus]|uniref:Uncharacterized protein n=1 Tax=Lupinus albus TaxID=3870 RepID=A0A6A4NNA7_LUPAL|nr:hypothetical protein Lalb_Chr17g0336041 [Lupinus albus]
MKKNHIITFWESLPSWHFLINKLFMFDNQMKFINHLFSWKNKPKVEAPKSWVDLFF